jgi:hypothetical protein
MTRDAAITFTQTVPEYTEALSSNRHAFVQVDIYTANSNKKAVPLVRITHPYVGEDRLRLRKRHDIWSYNALLSRLTFSISRLITLMQPCRSNMLISSEPNGFSNVGAKTMARLSVVILLYSLHWFTRTKKPAVQSIGA